MVCIILGTTPKVMQKKVPGIKMEMHSEEVSTVNKYSVNSMKFKFIKAMKCMYHEVFLLFFNCF